MHIYDSLIFKLWRELDINTKKCRVSIYTVNTKNSKNTVPSTIYRPLRIYRIFAMKPIADFSLSLGYWASKNASRDHVVKGEFVSLAKPIVLCTTGKRILCWSIFAIESIADFCPFWGHWTSKNGSRDHDVKS